MIITDAARDALIEALKAEGKNNLQFSVVAGSNGRQLNIDFIESDQGEYINGVLVSMDEEIAEFLDNVIIDLYGDALVFRPVHSCHGGCGGCHGGCSDEDDEGCSGGCCSGDDEGCGCCCEN